MKKIFFVCLLLTSTVFCFAQKKKMLYKAEWGVQAYTFRNHFPKNVLATLDTIKAFEAEALIGGRGAIARGRAEVDAAVEQTRDFLTVMLREVGAVHARGGTLKEAFEATHAALAPKYGHWPIFEHCAPFDVQRVWDELDGIDWPRIWTAERDQDVWAQLQD